VSTNTADLI